MASDVVTTSLVEGVRSPTKYALNIFWVCVGCDASDGRNHWSSNITKKARDVGVQQVAVATPIVALVKVAVWWESWWWKLIVVGGGDDTTK